VYQRQNIDPEISRVPGNIEVVTNPKSGANDSQESLSCEDVALVRRFFELLAKWEQRGRVDG
jgi:hypothetical protein